MKPLDVAEFPIDFFKGKSWRRSEKEDEPIFTVEIQHSPIQCNFAHCNLVFFENGVEIPEIKTPSIKAMIRRDMEPVMRRLIPIAGPWHE